MSKKIDENQYDQFFIEAAERYGYKDWVLLKAQVKAESNFNPKAVSPAGAMGLAQFMPATWKQMYPKGDPLNAVDSIMAQNKYMAWIEYFCNAKNKVDKLRASYRDHLICYNWGVGNWAKWNKNSGDFDSLPKETQNYLNKIERYYAQYTRDLALGE